jgi:hypothetical protein
VDIDVEPLLRHIERRGDFTFFQAVILALCKTLQQRPGANRFYQGRRLYQRRDVEMSFIARRRMDEEGTETSVKLRVKPDDDMDGVLAQMNRDVEAARRGEDKDDDKLFRFFLGMPRFLLRAAVAFLNWCDFHLVFPKDIEALDPLHCSVFLSNLGSVGIDAPFHHLYEWGNCSLFVCVGKIGKRVAVLDDGTVGVKTMCDFKITLDERIADGYYFARTFELFRRYLEHPETIMEAGEPLANEALV